MRSTILLTAIFLFSVLITGISKAELKPNFYQEQADRYIAQTKSEQPSFALLSQEQSGYEPLWRELLRQQLITSKKRDSAHISQAIALALAIQYVPPYLRYADDSNINYYFQLQRQFLLQAQTDGRLCRLLLNTQSSRIDQQGMSPWLLDKNYREYIPTLQTAMNQLITPKLNPWARQLPAEQSQLFMRRSISQMANTYGPDSIILYEQMNNENASPAKRCLGLYQLYETINTQPLELRAQLIRSFFGGQ
jgi:hypothetical protein